MPFGRQPNQIRFDDVTQSSGLFRKNQSWGVYWGDFNNDKLPDAFVHGHQKKPVLLYKNLGNGKFEEVARTVFSQFRESTQGDFHGAAWGDVDNDGDQDLLQLSGGDLGASDTNSNKNNKLFINSGNQLTDRAKSKGLQYPLGRGRVGLWFDINQDGLNDVIYTGPPRPDGRSRPTVFLQNRQGNFTDIGNSVRLSQNVPNGTFAMMSDLDGNNRPDLIYHTKQPSLTVYKTNTRPFTSIGSRLLEDIPRGLNIKDIAIADLNGDARPDIYIAQQGSPTSGFRTDGNRKGKVVLDVRKAEQGLNLKVSGEMTFNFKRDFALSSPSYFLNTTIGPKDIYLGSSGAHPNDLVFKLNSLNSRFHGLSSHVKGRDRGVYIGFDKSSQSWQIRFSSPKKDQLNFIYRSANAIGNITSVGFPQNGGARPDYLFIYDPQKKKFVDRTRDSGLGATRFPSRNVVAADFDNDMDNDLYVVATRNTKNVANILFENVGNGRFRRVPNAAGLEGTPFGIADSVAVADYNLDGFLEPLVVNGDVLGFGRPFWTDGSAQLFKNRGNNNHWIQIDLRGRQSNRDGVGAKVYVTAGGVRQLREQNGGIHNRAQNFQRLHFGLGSNRNVAKIEVRWPSGKTQVFRNVRADRLIAIDETRNTISGVSRLTAQLQGIQEEIVASNLVLGDEQDNRLLGSTAADVIRARAGDDTLRGRDGDDVLLGGAGEDVLVGGRGNDIFRFDRPQQGGDRIINFQPLSDQIVIQGANFASDLIQGVLRPGQFAVGMHRVGGATRFIYKPLTQELVFDPDGSGTQGAKALVQFDRPTALSANNIVIQ